MVYSLAGVPGSHPPLPPPPPPSGIRSGPGISDVFSECDTRPPTEDSKYIFYDPEAQASHVCVKRGWAQRVQVMSQLCGYSSGQEGSLVGRPGGSGKGVQQRRGRLEGAGLWERVPHTLGTF